MTKKKILVVRFSSIGDIVLTTPVVRALHQQLGAEVHYLTKQAFKGVLEANPYIAKLHLLQKDVSEVLPALRQERFDAVVDLHNNLRSAQVKWQLGAKRYAFQKLNWEKWLLVRFKLNRLPDRHIVDRYLAAAAPLGIHNDGQGLDYFISPADTVDTRPLLSTHGIPPLVGERDDQPPRYVAFVIGAAHATKRMPPEKITSICRNIDWPVLLLGGPDDAAAGQQIADAAGTHVINLCGQLRLNQSASLVQQAWQVITHDTGLMHIAAAFSKDIISVWGSTVPEFGMTPYYPEGVARNRSLQVQGLPCRPCSKIGFDTCPKGHFKCMNEIVFEGV